MILYAINDFKGNALSRECLAQALDDYCSKKEIFFGRNQSASFFLSQELKGKPFLRDFPQIQFSVSHSRNLWLCGIQDQPLGIDIECKSMKRGLSSMNAEGQTRFDKIAVRYFTVAEQKYVKTHGEDGFYQVWVYKEAYIKCKGTGISEVLASFSVIEEDQLIKRRKLHYLDEIHLNEMYLKEMHLVEMPINEMLFGKMTIEEQIYGAYCSLIPMEIEAVVELETKGEEQ